VPVTELRPPTTLAGFRVSEETVGRGIGATVKLMVVLLWRLPDAPVMMTVNVPVAAVLLQFTRAIFSEENQAVAIEDEGSTSLRYLS